MGEKLKALRRSAKLKQKDVAEKLDVTKSAVGMWENNKRTPNIIMLKKIAKAFGVTTDELLEDINV